MSLYTPADRVIEYIHTRTRLNAETINDVLLALGDLIKQTVNDTDKKTRAVAIPHIGRVQIRHVKGGRRPDPFRKTVFFVPPKKKIRLIPDPYLREFLERPIEDIHDE